MYRHMSAFLCRKTANTSLFLLPYLRGTGQIDSDEDIAGERRGELNNGDGLAANK